MGSTVSLCWNFYKDKLDQRNTYSTYYDRRSFSQTSYITCVVWFDLLCGDCCTLPYLNVHLCNIYIFMAKHVFTYITCTVICYQHSQNVRTFYFFHTSNQDTTTILYLFLFVIFYIRIDCWSCYCWMKGRERERELSYM